MRRLIFEMFFDADCWAKLRVLNFIYELISYNAMARTNRLNSKRRLGWKPTEKDNALLLAGLELVSTVAEEAHVIGTTLRFSEHEVQASKLKTLIVTG